MSDEIVFSLFFIGEVLLIRFIVLPLIEKRETPVITVKVSDLLNDERVRTIIREDAARWRKRS